jgi:hypothetical protein
MQAASRAHVASSFSITTGALIDETFAVFAAWDFAQTKRQNLERLREENFIGAKSAAWLRQISRLIHRRFEPNGRDRALVILAKSGCDLETWKPILFWHMTRDEFLVRDFLQQWLFPAYEAGVYRIRPDELHEYVRTIGNRGAMTKRPWSEATIKRVAVGLLDIARDLGLLRGRKVNEFVSYHLPEDSFLYLLHAMRDQHISPGKIVESPDWRMFLMRPSDVEHEILRLHQFRKLEYQAAGSLVELSLPCANSFEYAERMVA